MRATIITHHSSRPIAKSIEKSLEADNRNAPGPLQVKSKAHGTRVTTDITGAEDIESLLATTDDILFCLISADRVLITLDAKRGRSTRGS